MQKRYVTNLLQFYKSGDKYQDLNLVDITIINQGAGTIYINNNFELAAGASLSISNSGDGSTDQTTYKFTGAGALKVQVITRVVL
jgi:hypothetical protein